MRRPDWAGPLARFAEERGWTPQVCLGVSFVGVITGFAAYAEVHDDEVSTVAAVVLAVLVWIISALFWLIGWATWSVRSGRSGRRRTRSPQATGDGPAAVRAPAIGRSAKVRVREGGGFRWPVGRRD